MKPRIIGVTGRAQHGKDTTGGILVDAGYKRYAFADQLKALAYGIDPIVGYVIDREYLPVRRLAKLVDDIGWESAKAEPEVRRFLIALGIGVREHIGWDAWVRALERVVDNGDPEPVVITDVRFPNEAEWIHALGGIIIRVTRPGTDAVDPNNESERHVATLDADYDITNDGDIHKLRAKVTSVLYAATAAHTIGDA